LHLFGVHLEIACAIRHLPFSERRGTEISGWTGKGIRRREYIMPVVAPKLQKAGVSHHDVLPIFGVCVALVKGGSTGQDALASAAHALLPKHPIA
jgi:hypothetical protein